MQKKYGAPGRELYTDLWIHIDISGPLCYNNSKAISRNFHLIQ